MPYLNPRNRLVSYQNSAYLESARMIGILIRHNASYRDKTAIICKIQYIDKIY